MATTTATVTGRVTRADGVIIAVTVRAFDQDLRSRQLLGSVATDREGRYSITYTSTSYAANERATADLLIEAVITGGVVVATSPILYNAPELAVIDLVIPAELGPVEYDDADQKLLPLVTGATLTYPQLDERPAAGGNPAIIDASFLGGETGLGLILVADFILAHRIAATASLPPQFWYALLRTRTVSLTGVIPGSLADRAPRLHIVAMSTPVPRVEAALRSAVARRIIAETSPAMIPSWMNTFRALARESASTDGIAEGGYAEILDFTGLVGPARAAAADAIATFGRDRPAMIDFLVGGGHLTPAQGRTLEAALYTRDLALGTPAAFLALSGELSPAEGVRAIARLTPAEITALLGPGFVAPGFIRGADNPARVAAYVDLISTRVTQEFPTTAFSGSLDRRLASGPPSAIPRAAEIATFLHDQPAFDLARTSVAGFLDLNPGAGPADPVVRAEFTRGLQIAQRLHRLVPAHEAAESMLAAGIHSAQQAARMGQDQFIRAFAAAPGFTLDSAQLAYARAVDTSATIAGVLTDLRSSATARDFAAMAGPTPPPDFEHLFGLGDLCQCEHCRSVYSPAAYLTDLLLFLEHRDTLSTRSVREELLLRRPDIAYLELSCTNSHTLVPYIDLACEVMEDRVAPWIAARLQAADLALFPPPPQSGDTYPIAVTGALAAAIDASNPGLGIPANQMTVSAEDPTGRWILRHESAMFLVADDPGGPTLTVLRQTRKTAEEIGAEPEYINSAAYEVLLQAKYPLILPFDLNAETARTYLATRNVRRAEVMRVFRSADPPANPTQADVGAEYAGVSAAEQTHVFTPHTNDADQNTYWGNTTGAAMSNVDTFLRRTGLEYNDLLTLLTLESVNPSAPGGARTIQHQDASCDLTRKSIVPPLDGTARDRINRFLRLWRKLGLKMWEVDLLITTLGNGSTIDPATLGSFLRLRDRLSTLAIDELASFFGNIDSTPKFTQAFEPAAPALFQRLFPGADPAQPLDASVVRAGLRLRDVELAALRTLTGLGAGPYTLDNVSLLHRHARFARAAGLGIEEWAELAGSFIEDPFDSPAVTIDAADTVTRYRAAGLSALELQYILHAVTTVRPALTDAAINDALATLRATLLEIPGRYTLPDEEEPSGNRTLLEAMTRDAGWDAATVAELGSLLLAGNDSHAVCDAVPGGFNAAVAANSIPIVFNSDDQRLTFRGIMTVAQRDLLKNLPGGTGPYTDGINELMEYPRLVLSFARPVFTAPLRSLPRGLNDAMLGRQRLTYDPGARRLTFSGIMSSVERAQLLALAPGDGAYAAAIASLFDQCHTPPLQANKRLVADEDLPDDGLPETLQTLGAVAAGSMLAFLLRYLPEAEIVQTCSALAGTTPDMTRLLLERFPAIDALGRPLIDHFKAVVDGGSSFDPAGSAFVSARLLHRAGLVIARLALDVREVNFLIDHTAHTALLDPTAIPPLFPPPLPPTGATTLANWLDLADLVRLSHRTRTSELSLIDVIDSRILTPGSYGAPEIAADAELLLGWDAANVQSLIDAFDLIVPAPDPSDILRWAGWRRLSEAFAMMDRLGGTPAQLAPLAAATVTAPAIRGLKDMLRSSLGPDQWLETSGAVQDVLRERKRESLGAYLAARPLDNPLGTLDALYAQILIDPQMSKCDRTSRLVQATGAVQLFVQRCLLGLEPNVRASAEDDGAWDQWKWMKNYRVWEANRKVFLYPENWIEASLRRDKSEPFALLENELLQNELTTDNIQTAFEHFLDGVDDVARLDVLGTHHDDAEKTLHVVARTRTGDPPTYYHRTLVNNRRWTAWEKIELDIRTDVLVPFMLNRRLYLAWIEFREEARTEPGMAVTVNLSTPTNLDDKRPQKRLSVHLAMSEKRSGKWSPKRVSKTGVALPWPSGATPEINTDPYLLLPLDLTEVKNVNRFLIYIGYDLRGTGEIDNPISIVGIFELFGCDGVPVPLGHARAPFPPKLPTFSRSELVDQKYVEQGGRDGNDALEDNPNHHPGTRVVLQKTPGQFRISYPCFMSSSDRARVVAPGSEARFGTDQPWFYADYTRTFFVRPLKLKISGDVTFIDDFAPAANFVFSEIVDASDFITVFDAPVVTDFIDFQQLAQLSFQVFYHPFPCRFKTELLSEGLEGLFHRKVQFLAGTFDFGHDYDPTGLVHEDHPTEAVDFDLRGSYSSYNWELFFHAPLLIASRLSADQRFEEAMRWYHFIFDPTGSHDVDPRHGTTAPAPQRYWITRPFFDMQAHDYLEQRIDNLLRLLADDPANPTDPALLAELRAQVADWRDNPFEPHVIAAARPVAYQKATVMKYIDNLIAWGDQLFRQDTRESVSEAALLYIRAAEILGRRPRSVPPAQKPVSQTYSELAPRLDDFGNTLVGLENLLPVLDQVGWSPKLPTTLAASPPPPMTLYFCVPQNDKLLGYWDTVADRLFKVRHCMNIEGVVRSLDLFAPPIDPGALVRAVASGVGLDAAIAGLSAPIPHYRFAAILQRANELAGDLKALGAAVLSALEKKDAEALALLRQQHEMRLLDASRAVRQMQLEDARTALDGLLKNREMVTIRRDFYASRDFISDGETAALNLTKASLVLEAVAGTLTTVAGVLSNVPTFEAGTAGAGGTPVLTTSTGGSDWADGLNFAAQAVSFAMRLTDRSASIVSTVAGYKRRKEDWDLQRDLANKELEQLDRQIAGAQIRVAIAEREIANHDLQVTQSKAVDDFMRSKYTNLELYAWHQQQLGQIFFPTYQLALDTARRAERSFQYELGVEDSAIIRPAYWDNLKSGLLCGERLQLDLRRLDAAYMDENRRELELTKSVSLAILDPVALEELKRTGRCSIDLPEEIFDLDYPGHYFRRLRSVRISIPAVAGPYTTVACTLRLLKGTTRVLADAADPYPRTTAGGLPADDARFRDNYAVVDSMATSTAQNDSGLFELNFRDERYLPFEGAGAISRWELELMKESLLRQFDFGTITDVVMHLSYTARDAGRPLRDKAAAHLTSLLEAAAPAEGPLAAAFDLRREFPAPWHTFLHPVSGPNTLTVRLDRGRFPFLGAGAGISLRKLHVIARVPTAPDDPIAISIASAAIASVTPSPITLSDAGNGFFAGDAVVTPATPITAGADLALTFTPALSEDNIADCILIAEYALAT